jgi:LPS sulfotransferase NodH
MRPIAEVVASQDAMTNHLGTRGAQLEPEQLERGLRAHREEVRRWAKTTAEIEWLEVNYPALVNNPEPAIEKLIEFLGRERLPNDSEIAAVVDPSLHRRRKP